MKAFAAVVAITVCLSLTAVYGQEGQPANQEPARTSSADAPEWVWGEVTSTDSAAKSITLTYIDYETDSGKSLVIAVGDGTKFENIVSFGDIKPGATLSIDYYPAGGKNEAAVISLEQIEEIPDIEEMEPVNPAAILEKLPVPETVDDAAAEDPGIKE